MKSQCINLDGFAENLVSVTRYYQSQLSRGDEQKMATFLKKAIKRELTPRQQQCVAYYYYDKMKMADIAKQLGLNTSTVSRHLKKARERLSSVISYYCTHFIHSGSRE